jgi:FtsZ-binding cell division protein ZapB
MYAPSFNNTSARAKKQSIAPVSPDAVLDGVTELDVSTWEFTDTDDGRHMGPMAGDFHDAFELGDDDETIASVDADGVALAAIQGLADRLERKNDRIDHLRDRLAAREGRVEDLEDENEALRERQAELEDRLDALEVAVADAESS